MVSVLGCGTLHNVKEGTAVSFVRSQGNQTPMYLKSDCKNQYFCRGKRIRRGKIGKIMNVLSLRMCDPTSEVGELHNLHMGTATNSTTDYFGDWLTFAMQQLLLPEYLGLLYN